jgi:hypothetical protein
MKQAEAVAWLRYNRVTMTGTDLVNGEMVLQKKLLLSL